MLFKVFCHWKGSKKNEIRRQCLRGHDGFSLIEVLISMLVLTVGVIGAVGMQLAALRTTQQSAYQRNALQIASDIADAIRALKSLPNVTGEARTFPPVDYNSANSSEPTAPGTSCFTDPCDAQALIDFEVYEWKKRVRAVLPSGRVLVCYDSSPWDEAKKSWRWGCSGASGGGTPLVVKIGWQIKNPDGSPVLNADGSVPPGVALSLVPV